MHRYSTLNYLRLLMLRFVLGNIVQYNTLNNTFFSTMVQREYWIKWSVLFTVSFFIVDSSSVWKIRNILYCYRLFCMKDTDPSYTCKYKCGDTEINKIIVFLCCLLGMEYARLFLTFVFTRLEHIVTSWSNNTNYITNP